MLAAWRGLPANKPTSAGRSFRRMVRAYGTLLREPGFLSYCLIAACSSGAFFVFLGAAPALFTARGVAPHQIGWFILFVPVPYIIGNLATTRLVGRLSNDALLSIGRAFSFTGICVVLALAWLGYMHPLAVSVPLITIAIIA